MVVQKTFYMLVDLIANSVGVFRCSDPSFVQTIPVILKGTVHLLFCGSLQIYFPHKGFRFLILLHFPNLTGRRKSSK
jgi:hypothetical protein